MFKRTQTGWVEYKIIPEREQIVKHYTDEEFAKLQSDLEVELERKPEEVGAEVLAEKQSKLSEMTAVKLSATSVAEEIK